MASREMDRASPRHTSSDSSDDSDSQDSDIMPRVAGAAGIRMDRKTAVKGKSDAEPKKEKRRKAKRACRPCQVAHLTCGDDRPCSRCVKRGCAAQCRDGVRKKAKYLEDTPTEALMQDKSARGRSSIANIGFSQPTLSTLPSSSDLFGGQTTGSSGYALYATGGQMSLPPSSMASSPHHHHPHHHHHQHHRPPGFGMEAPSMASQANLPLTQSSFATLRDFHDGGAMPQTTTLGTNAIPGSSLGDLFPVSFDVEGFDFTDFDNRYGAAEFGMLNHMSTGMANSPPSDSTGTLNLSGSNYTPGTMSAVFEQSPPEESPFSYPGSQGLSQWASGPSADVRTAATATANKYHFKGSSQEGPPAFAIGASALPSPSSISSPQGMAMAGCDDGPTNKNLITNPNPSYQAQVRPDHAPSHQRPGLSAVSASTTSTPSVKVQTLPSRRHRNPSAVYEDVKNPYSYTAAFHSLTALIQRRFSPHKTAHIAKALAAIRPSFISSTMKLTRDDLVFMEKCLQRTLWEFEDFISATATPTIICRRTGEIVAVGKEFSILTGWTANVLLGREPNLNVNHGGGDLSSGNPGTGASSRGGTNTPRNPNDTRMDQPVNIVDLLDDESACDFFDDYAHLAFGDSRGSVTTPCKLLQYRTADETNLTGNLEDHVDSKLKRQRDHGPTSGGSKPRGEGEGGVGGVGVGQLGNTNGTVDCMLCWFVKRDVFDIPMLCVLNVSHPDLSAPGGEEPPRPDTRAPQGSLQLVSSS